MSYLLSATNISKSYGAFKALNDVSIDVAKGSIHGLLGPNGAGKTSLIRIINQIILPDDGHIHFDNTTLNPTHIKDIGYLPEERGLYKSMKVGDQIMYLAQLKGLQKSEAKKRLKYWFEKLEIGDWWHKKIHELSKGQAQKIQFITTVLHEPKLLIFDEPFSGFDPVNANLIKEEILELRSKGATVIFSTHRMESVEELCDHITLIHQSNKILDGPLTEVKRQYKSNVFEVGLSSKPDSDLKAIIGSKFEIFPPSFKNLNDDLKLNIKLDESSNSNDLLSFLLNHAEVNHFVEVIPSVNDIFIKSVNEN